MRKIIVILLGIMLSGWIYTIGAETDKAAKKESGGVSKIDLEWPPDKYSGFANYAQELVFHKERGLYYLDEAKKYYDEGYNLIKFYVTKPDEYDFYKRDPYKTEMGTPTALSVAQDFADAEYYFTLSLNIVAHFVQWDPELTQKPLYKSLVQNTFRNLIYVSTYNANFDKALKYIDEYRKFNPDDMDFVEEWEARILGNIVKVHEKYDWAFTGKLKAASLKKKHRELLLKIIEKKYGNNPTLKKELINRIYPEFVVIPTQKNNTSNKNASAK